MEQFNSRVSRDAAYVKESAQGCSPLALLRTDILNICKPGNPHTGTSSRSISPELSESFPPRRRCSISAVDM